jgi:chemotaxis response regulator CheB
MTWIDYLGRLLTEVANGRAGQAGQLTLAPPDERSGVRLRAKLFVIEVESPPTVTNYRPDQAKEAVEAYAAAVEGEA